MTTPSYASARRIAAADLPLAVGPAMSATLGFWLGFGETAMFTATLIGDALGAGDIAAARDRLAAVGCVPGAGGWLDEGVAIDLSFAADSAAARDALEGAFARTDVVVQPTATRRKALIVADMDSTMITVECIDELADYAGIKAEVAAATEAAMRGELDFEGALDARVALLAGLDEGVIAQCLAERVRIMPGAKALVGTMRAHGAAAVLVSGGFTRFAEPVAAQIGFDAAIANVLLIEDGRLTGKVAKPIVGSATKEETLLAWIAQRGIDPALSLAVGDGANDLAMIRRAGLGVAYHAKPIVAAAAGARVDHGDLSVLLYAQGYRRSDWVN
jgi:phosphoserine phosphatase